MNKSEFQELLQKCFGKKKDARYHAVSMLIIYGIFIFIIILAVRIGGSSHIQENVNPSSSPMPEINSNSSVPQTEMNYTYSYIITYHGNNEIYLGKKIGEKQKFTLITDHSTVDYAALGDHYFILENDTYHTAESPSKFLKYCDREKIELLVANEIPTENNNTISYSVSNQVIATFFHEVLEQNQDAINLIQLHTVNGIVKEIDVDFSHYLSALEQTDSSFKIHMEFVDIGTTEDFEISF